MRMFIIFYSMGRSCSKGSAHYTDLITLKIPLKQILSDKNILQIRFTTEIIVLIDYNLLPIGWNKERVYIVKRSLLFIRADLYI